MIKISKSKIEWTDVTWNPVSGCTKRSPGCDHCYAERFAKRLKAMGNKRYKNGFKVTLHWDKIEAPLSWRKPRMVFVNSMGDLLHEKVPLNFIQKCFEVMNKKTEHVFQILTKNAKRLEKINSKVTWTKNIWMGVSIENNDYNWRSDYLRNTNAKVKFISFEPLLASVNKCNLNKIDWVIVGGESGPQARPMKREWVIEIRNKCLKKDIPFFFKQWGGFHAKANGRKLDGEVWDQRPVYEVAR